MTNFWYNNPLVLLKNLNEFYPRKNLNKIHQVNSLARLAMYIGIIMIIFKLNGRYLLLLILLLIISYCMGKNSYNNFANTKCIKPTNNNPFMNFTLGDQITNPNRAAACQMNKNIRDEEIKAFRFNMFPDIGDMYGKIISDRDFYTMPSTTAANDQPGFLNFLYGDTFGKCKANGTDCLKHTDTRFGRGRYYYQY